MFWFCSEYFLCIGDVTYPLGRDMVSVKRYQETRHVEEITPSVIEPSFGESHHQTKIVFLF